MAQNLNSDETPSRVLVVDDEPAVRSIIRLALEAEGYEIVEADGGPAAQGILEVDRFDLVITDLQMPQLDGLRLMQWAQQAKIDASWIILTGHGTFDGAVRAVQLGAFDFITKPLPVIDALVVSVRNCLRQRHLIQQHDRMHEQIQQNNVRLRKQVHQLRQAVRLLLAQAETIGEDLRRAELIQRAMLPAAAPDLDGYCVNTIYRPSRQVGGDLYDVARLDDRHIAIYVADAAGHGVSAAMLAVLFKHRLPVTHGQPPEPTQPAEVLAAVNDCLLSEFSRPGLFVTAAYGLLDTATGELTVASAGHPSLVLHHADGRSERIGRTGPALGLDEHAQIGQHTYTLGRGDRLLLFTDGLYEDEHAAASLDHAVDDLLQASGRGGREVLDDLVSRAADLRGGKASTDDMTLVLLTAGPGESTIDNGSGLADQEAEALQGTEPIGAPAEAAGGLSVEAKFAAAADAAGDSGRPSVITIPVQSQETAEPPADEEQARRHAEEQARERAEETAWTAAQAGSAPAALTPPGSSPADPDVAGEPPMGVGVHLAGHHCTITVRGRGTWTFCAALHDVGFSQLDAHHSLVLDFSRCAYLDSTFLGTVQEMVEHADRERVEVRVQGVSPAVRAQFEELGMDRVLQHISSSPQQLPGGLEPLSSSPVGENHQRRRILYAHEALAALTEHNRRQFLHLIESMRGELAKNPQG